MGRERMSFVISSKPNAGYNGKHKEAATKMVKEGKRVGIVILSPDSCTFFCHICHKDQSLPAEASPSAVVASSEKIDHLGACPGCKTPFIFWEF
jgi:hypothetical protein